MTFSCTGKCCRLLLVLTAVPLFSLFAQQKNYTLKELVDTAQKYLPLLLEKKALIYSSKAAIRDTKNSFLPETRLYDQLNIGTDNSVAGSYFPAGIIPSTSSGVNEVNNNSAAAGNIAILYSQYDLIDFGYKKEKINNARAYADLSEADLQRTSYDIKAQVAEVYFNLLKSEAKLSANNENIERYENIFEVIRALTVSGIKAGSDSSLAKAELSQTRISYNQTSGLVNQLKQQLSFLTGIPAPRLNIDTSVMQAAREKRHAYATDRIAVSPVIGYYQQLQNTYLSDEQLVAKSFQPKIMLTGSTWIRGSSIGYGNDYKSLATGIGYQRFNYLAGISFQYELFNGIHRRDRQAVYRFRRQAADFELEQQKLLLLNSSLQADNDIKTAEANLSELPIQLVAAQDTYNQKIAQYKAGIINLIDLTNAAYVLYRSVTDYAETVGDWYISQLNKATATGNLDAFIQTIK